MEPEFKQNDSGMAGQLAARPALGREDTLRCFFLGRLEYLIRVRDGAGGGLKTRDDWLIKRALYSTYRDCVSVGVGDEAGALLKA